MDGKCDRELLEKIQISSVCVGLEVEERGQKGKREIEKGDRTRDECYGRGTINTRTYPFQKKEVFINKKLPICVTIVPFIAEK